jgi:glycosyltransferase involved in cell wall biosynthesis
MTLRVGVDAREIIGDRTGVGQYLGELLRRWTNRADAATRRFVLYAPEPIPLTFPPGTAEVRILRARGPSVVTGRGRGTWWEQTSLRRAVSRDPLDVFFAPAYTAPLGVSVPLAVTIHDVSFLAHPEWFRPREGMRRRWLTSRAAAAARVIFTDSEFSRTEIVGHLRVDPSRVRVIPPGVAPRTRPGGGDVPRAPLVLYVGSIFNRRRVPDLIEAFAHATRDLPDARLAIVGDDRTWPQQDLAAVARAFDVAGRVDLLRYVSDAELASLYSRAAVFVFLSEYEGFGLTPLEALSAGVPVVVLDTPVSREVYGPAAFYVGRRDIEGTAAVIRMLLTTPGAGAATLSEAPRILARYSWDRAAEETLAGIEHVGGRSG